MLFMTSSKRLFILKNFGMVSGKRRIRREKLLWVQQRRCEDVMGPVGTNVNMGWRTTVRMMKLLDLWVRQL